MKKIFILLSLCVLTSCQDIDGQFQAQQNLTLDSQDGAEQILAGQYSAKVKVSSKKKMVLSLDQLDKKLFTFKVPKGTSIPDNGEIDLSRDDVGQAYDVHGVVSTNVTRGQVQEGYESCTYQRPYTVCRTDPRGNRTCWTEYRTEFGNHYVRYYIETIVKNLNFSLMDQGISQAQFNGTDSASYRREIYSDQCH